ncbi:unnamed protein product [Rotaria sordida]|uniref:Uncharacterized protein n=1 Tax=Rotaria sordida TaxID=392033 RepID=A0A819JU98_9BILA|nr:unnamed protein product [Rotaria sordida]
MLLFPILSIDIYYPSRLLSYWTPANIVISPINQHIFMVDMSFNRVLHLSPEAIYISTLNLPIEQSKFYSPLKLTIDLAGYLYVATGAYSSLAMIYKYRTTNDQLIKNISLPFYVPTALTISPINGDIYVATTDTKDTSIYVLNKNGEQINKFNTSNFSPPLSQPTALTMDKTAERLYVADRNDSTTGRIFVINSQTGRQLQVYINSNIYRPTAVIVDVNLNVYVADMATNCIIALTSNGTLIRTYTNSLYNPQGLTFAPYASLLLSDTLNNRLVLFDVISAKVLQIYSSHDPVLIAPRLVALLNSGDIYVNSLTDDIAYNILKKLTITNSSANVTQIINPKPHFGFPVGLALDTKNQIYVTDADIPYGYIHMFASNGTEIGRIYTNNPPLKNPHGIATDLQGNLYVADSGNVRVIKLLINGTIIQNYQTTPPLQYVYDVKHIVPDRVIGLILSNDEDTPGLAELFLTYFQINQFTYLQSLTLFDIGPHLWENIIQNMVELKNLHSFFYTQPSRTNSWISDITGNDIGQLDSRLFNIYVDIVKHISSVATQLKSLATKFELNDSTTQFIYPLTQLKRLVLEIEGSNISINQLEEMMSNLPRLKHLILIANCNRDVVNGQRWQMILQHLITFNFMFYLSVSLESQDLDSFRTSFWLEEKHWFVACGRKNLYSVPHFYQTTADEDFQFPLCSTVSDNIIFYETINRLTLSSISNNTNHYFPHVQTLVSYNDYYILMSTINDTTCN